MGTVVQEVSRRKKLGLSRVYCADTWTVRVGYDVTLAALVDEIQTLYSRTTNTDLRTRPQWFGVYCVL